MWLNLTSLSVSLHPLCRSIKCARESSCLGLRVDVANQIDSGSHSPKSFTNTVQRALSKKNWDKGEPRMALVRDERPVVPANRSTKRSFGALASSS